MDGKLQQKKDTIILVAILLKGIGLNVALTRLF